MIDRQAIEILKVAVGLGFPNGVSRLTLEGAIAEALRTLGEAEVCCVASHIRKADDPALLELAQTRGWPLRLFPAAKLAAVQVPNPSSRAASEVGTPSVAEAAALLAAGGGELLVEKRVYRGADGKGAAVAIAHVSRERKR